MPPRLKLLVSSTLAQGGGRCGRHPWGLCLVYTVNDMLYSSHGAALGCTVKASRHHSQQVDVLIELEQALSKVVRHGRDAWWTESQGQAGPGFRLAPDLASLMSQGSPA